MLILIDSHNHFDDASFDGDRDAAYQRARPPEWRRKCWRRSAPDCGRSSGRSPRVIRGCIPATACTRPIWPSTDPSIWMRWRTGWFGNKPTAIGECGLDYYLPDLDPDAQAEYFAGQLRLARRHDLPVIIHARHAVDQVIKHLRRFAGVRGVVHSFSGSEDQARRLLDLGISCSASAGR
jgi:TatD DNase family protein